MTPVETVTALCQFQTASTDDGLIVHGEMLSKDDLTSLGEMKLAYLNHNLVFTIGSFVSIQFNASNKAPQRFKSSDNFKMQYLKGFSLNDRFEVCSMQCEIR